MAIIVVRHNYKIKKGRFRFDKVQNLFISELHFPIPFVTIWGRSFFCPQGKEQR